MLSPLLRLFLKNLPIFEELDEGCGLRSLATPCLRDLVLLNYAGNLTGFFEIVIVTHLYDVPQLKLFIPSNASA